MEERVPSDVVFVVPDEESLDACKTGADAVLVPLHGGEINDVGQVRGEEFVALSFRPNQVRRQVGELLTLPDAARAEDGIDSRRRPVAVLTDCGRDAGVLDQSFGDLDGDGSASAGRPFFRFEP
jgi:hypothetical protein